MLSLTRKADYALVALVALGYRWRHEQGPISARQLAESFTLPGPLLMNTLKDLARHGLVRAQRGAAGGYELADDPATVTLLAVIRAVEGKDDGRGTDDGEGTDDVADDAPEENPSQEDHDNAPTTGPAVVRRLEQWVFAYLKGLTLADLLDAPDATADGQPSQPIPLNTQPSQAPQ